MDEADQGHEARIAVGGIAPGCREIGDLVGEAGHDGGVALAVGAVEQQPRVRQPGEDTASHDLGRPGVRCRRPRLIHSPRSCSAIAGPRRSDASRWRSQPKPLSSRAQAGLGARPRTASGPRAWRRSRRGRSCRRRPRRQSSNRGRAGRAAPAAAPRPPARDSASAAGASGACGRVPRVPRAPRRGRRGRCARGRCGAPGVRAGDGPRRGGAGCGARWEVCHEGRLAGRRAGAKPRGATRAGDGLWISGGAGRWDK